MKNNEEQWKQDGCSIRTDDWADRKRRSIMNLCVNSRMGIIPACKDTRNGSRSVKTCQSTGNGQGVN